MSLELSGTNKIVHDNLNQNIKDLLMPKNWIINGGFDVWQRGTSQTTGGFGSDDRWRNDETTSTKTHSRQSFTVGQTDVPNNPTYFSRTVVTTGGTAGSTIQKSQRIEDVTKLAGKTISISFWAKADASKNISIEFIQDFGTGGSVAIYTIGVQKFALTTSWQRFTATLTLPSASGKTIGTSSSTFFRFWFDAGSTYNANTNSLGNQSGTFDIANVSLVEGSVPVEWQTETYADVLRQCLRYYWRVLSETAYGVLLNSGYTTSSLNVLASVELPVKMRVAPTSVEYNLLQVLDYTSAYNVTAVSLGDGNNSSFVNVNATISGATAGRPVIIRGQASANAYIGFSAEL